MRPPIKVLIVSTSDSSGGAARAAYRIHQAVKRQGLDCKMFVKDKSIQDDGIISLDTFIPQNIFYKSFDWIRNKVKNKLQHFIWGRYPNRSRIFMSDMRSTSFHGALKKLDYDVLNLHWTNLRFLPFEDLPNDKPIVWTLHDTWAFCGICHYFFECERYKMECGCCPFLASDDPKDLSHSIWVRKQHIYKNLDLHILTPSRWLGECVRKSSLLGRFQVSVIPNCIDTSVFRPLEEGELSPRWQYLQDIKASKPILLYGAMNATTDNRKGFSFLLSAMQIMERLGKNDSFELIVFGADRPLEGMPMAGPVHYVGYISDSRELASLYNLASAMIVPSLTENLSCTIMESLSCGTPVVAFNIGGNSDLIDHKQNGYLANEKDSEDLAEGILWCLDNNRDNKLSQNARKKVLENYTPEVVGKQYTEFFLSVIK